MSKGNFRKALLLMQTKISWYNPIGNSAYSRLDRKKKGEIRILTGRMIEDKFKMSGIMRITHDRRHPTTFIVHTTIFHANGQTDIERHFSAQQLRLMFILHLEVTGNDYEFAREYGALYGIPGMFIRRERKLSFPCPGTAIPGDPNFCVEIKEFMQVIVEKLINGEDV